MKSAIKYNVREFFQWTWFGITDHSTENNQSYKMRKWSEEANLSKYMTLQAPSPFGFQMVLPDITWIRVDCTPYYDAIDTTSLNYIIILHNSITLSDDLKITGWIMVG